MNTVAIIGCTIAGTHAAISILKEHPDWTVDVFERNSTVSFVSASIAQWVGGHVGDKQNMFCSSPEQLEQLGAHMHMRHEVVDANVENMTLEAKNLETGELTHYDYDKLVIATGSKSAIPDIQGIEKGQKNGTILPCKNYNDALSLVEKTKDVTSVAIVGAGYIGVELAEQFSLRNVKTTLIDALPHILGNEYDPDVESKAEQELQDHGVQLALGQKVVAFRSEPPKNGQTNGSVTVVTELESYDADLVIMGVGFIPNTRLVSAQLHTLGYGAIIVDDFMRASNTNGEILTNVFAAGDCATVHFTPTDSNEYRPLASNAIRQGMLVGRNIDKPVAAYAGSQCTTAVQLYDMCLASSGVTLERALRRHIDAASITITSNYRSGFMTSNTPVTVTLVWNKDTKKVLGAQFAARHDISMAANLISVAIQAGFTISQLAEVDQLYQPNFAKPINFIAEAANAAIAQDEQGR